MPLLPEIPGLRFSAPGDPTTETPSSTPTSDLPAPRPPAGSSPSPTPSPEDDAAGWDAAPEPPGPARNARGALRTATSSPGDDRPKTDPKVAGRVAATLIGALLMLMGWAASHRRGWELRQPTDDELRGMGDPLGRIAGRHLPQGVVNADLLDAADFADGVRRYVTADALLIPTHAEPGQDPAGSY